RQRPRGVLLRRGDRRIVEHVVADAGIRQRGRRVQVYRPEPKADVRRIRRVADRLRARRHGAQPDGERAADNVLDGQRQKKRRSFGSRRLGYRDGLAGPLAATAAMPAAPATATTVDTITAVLTPAVAPPAAAAPA